MLAEYKFKVTELEDDGSKGKKLGKVVENFEYKKIYRIRCGEDRRPSLPKR